MNKKYSPEVPCKECEEKIPCGLTCVEIQAQIEAALAKLPKFTKVVLGPQGLPGIPGQDGQDGGEIADVTIMSLPSGSAPTANYNTTTRVLELGIPDNAGSSAVTTVEHTLLSANDNTTATLDNMDTIRFVGVGGIEFSIAKVADVVSITVNNTNTGGGGTPTNPIVETDWYALQLNGTQNLSGNRTPQAKRIGEEIHLRGDLYIPSTTNNTNSTLYTGPNQKDLSTHLDTVQVPKQRAFGIQWNSGGNTHRGNFFHDAANNIELLKGSLVSGVQVATQRPVWFRDIVARRIVNVENRTVSNIMNNCKETQIPFTLNAPGNNTLTITLDSFPAFVNNFVVRLEVYAQNNSLVTQSFETFTTGDRVLTRTINFGSGQIFRVETFVTASSVDTGCDRTYTKNLATGGTFFVEEGVANEFGRYIINIGEDGNGSSTTVTQSFTAVKTLVDLYISSNGLVTVYTQKKQNATGVTDRKTNNGTFKASTVDGVNAQDGKFYTYTTSHNTEDARFIGGYSISLDGLVFVRDSNLNGINDTNEFSTSAGGGITPD
jgi:hypothetical protein